eukprot:CAMPEP_0168565888 /NCGR_PEP_ID=MMETSP0413-20121227/14107_1 /TAXON_ID=136452 /ORGANISM="Filamoeba nolandi, Strain NC-AS-23-1" /LENGTH=483 /DNA_ID=CAMNT_0008597833 /DNA_START=117 /DNA_END=1568 /DNA_ORIENTATION=-
MTKQQLAIMNVFRTYQIPLTLGVAADYFGVDTQTVGTIKIATAAPTWPTEIACNGFSYTDMSALTQQQQVQQLTRCSAKLNAIFGKKPTTFVPPMGAFNAETLAAMQVTGFTHLSAFASTDNGPYPLKNTSLDQTGVWRFPAGAATNNMTNTAYYSPLSADATWASVQAQIAANGFAVVDIHPYEFAPYNKDYGFYDESTVNTDQIQQLTRLIYLIRAAGKRVNLVSQINSFVDVPYKPPCVAFRLDDIQDYYMVMQQTAVMNVFAQIGAPLSIGVIANQFGRDVAAVNAVRALLTAYPNTFEVCSHGWNHENFGNLSQSTQSQLLGQSVTRIQSTLNTRTTCFIPPFNTINSNTAAACTANGITVMSAEVDEDKPPYNTAANPPSNGLWRFPINASTAIENTSGYYVGIPANSTLAQIKTQMTKLGYAAVMMHPYEFGTFNEAGIPDDTELNNSQITELQNVILGTVMFGAKLVPLGKLNQC